MVSDTYRPWSGQRGTAAPAPVWPELPLRVSRRSAATPGRLAPVFMHSAIFVLVPFVGPTGHSPPSGPMGVIGAIFARGLLRSVECLVESRRHGIQTFTFRPRNSGIRPTCDAAPDGNRARPVACPQRLPGVGVPAELLPECQLPEVVDGSRSPMVRCAGNASQASAGTERISGCSVNAHPRKRNAGTEREGSEYGTDAPFYGFRGSLTKRTTGRTLARLDKSLENVRDIFFPPLIASVHLPAGVAPHGTVGRSPPRRHRPSRRRRARVRSGTPEGSGAHSGQNTWMGKSCPSQL
jgi:hypothetical protein